MSILTMEEEDYVNVRFVLPRKYKSEEECSNIMKISYQLCVDHNLSPNWILEMDCLHITPTKIDVFVCEEFHGQAFQYLRNLKSVRLVGPRCLLTCIMDGTPIPAGELPVYTTAMKDLVVCVTNFIGDHRQKLIQKIQYMGGEYSFKLTERVTHLVANSVLSKKYQVAIRNKLPVMKESWICQLWEESQEHNVSGNDSKYYIHKCPVFFGVAITVSNLTKEEKASIKSLVIKHGGTFHGELDRTKISVLIVPIPDGEKFKFASKWNIPSVLPSWIYNSIKKGSALAFGPYKVEGQKCSTPVKDKSHHEPDFSMMSSIQGGSVGANVTHINESVLNSTQASEYDRASIKTNKGPHYTEILSRLLDLNIDSKAGTFLDGCKVYLSGFSQDVVDKVRRVLNRGGATRFNNISDAVSHVITGDFVHSDMALLRTMGVRPHVVTLEWLNASVRLCRPAPEEEFLCLGFWSETIEPPSPLSKKGIQLLQNTSKRYAFPVLELTDVPDSSMHGIAMEDEPSSLMQQYSQHNDVTFLDVKESELYGKNNKGDPSMQAPTEEPAVPGTDSTVTQSYCLDETTITTFLSGLTFLIVGYDKEITEEMQDQIIVRGGKVLLQTSMGIPDYGIVPLHQTALHHTTQEIVTYIWLEDCCEQNQLLAVQYFHQPFNLASRKKPLKSCVISMSSYIGQERLFLTSLVEALGAKFQDMLVRKDRPLQNLLASTHLICSGPGSTKCNAAIKWQITVITNQWLLECAKEGRLVDDKAYLVKDNNLVEKNLPIQTCSNPRVAHLKSDIRANKGNQDSSDNEVDITKLTTALKVAEGSGTMEMATTKELGHTESSETPRRTDFGFSQETPIRIPRLSLGTPESLRQSTSHEKTMLTPSGTPKPPFFVATPNTPYGQQFTENPSPATRKRWKNYFDKYPDFPKDSTALKRRRQSTPVAELKTRLWSQFGVQAQKNNIDSEIEKTHEGHHEERLQAGESNDKQFLDASDGTNVTGDSTLPTSRTNSNLKELQNILLTQPKIQENRRNLERRSREMVDDVNSPNNDGDFINQVKLFNMPTMHSQHDQVEWEDPSCLKDLNTSLQPKNVSRPTLMFMFTNIENRERYEEMVLALGGEVTDVQNFNPDATHLVCNRPSRSEKLLASIASGKWVLHKCYLEQSMKHGHFLEEQQYEWGNPLAVAMLPNLDKESMDYNLAQAAHRWRLRLSKQVTGAFEGMVAVVDTSKSRIEPFKRLILAGGGRVQPSSNLDEVTHYFVEGQQQVDAVDMKSLVLRKIPCLHPLFLNKFLTMEPRPNPESCVIEQYSAIMNRLM